MVSVQKRNFTRVGSVNSTIGSGNSSFSHAIVISNLFHTPDLHHEIKLNFLLASTPLVILVSLP